MLLSEACRITETNDWKGLPITRFSAASYYRNVLQVIIGNENGNDDRFHLDGADSYDVYTWRRLARAINSNPSLCSLQMGEMHPNPNRWEKCTLTLIWDALMHFTRNSRTTNQLRIYLWMCLQNTITKSFPVSIWVTFCKTARASRILNWHHGDHSLRNKVTT
jgi:hypothetical protein